jgi:hypothetical protein
MPPRAAAGGDPHITVVIAEITVISKARGSLMACSCGAPGRQPRLVPTLALAQSGFPARRRITSTADAKL